MAGLSIGNVIPTLLRAGGEAVMLTNVEKEWTYKEEYERINQLSHALIDLGIGRSEVVGYMVHTCREAVEVMFSSWSSGFLAANINIRFREKELEYVMNNCEMKILVIDDDFIDEVRKVLPETKVEHVIVRETGLKKEIPEDWFEYERLIGKYPKTEPKVPWEPLGPDDTMIIENTTGTTGYPKGVMYSMGGFLGLFTEAGTYLKGMLPEFANLPEDVTIANPIANSVFHSNLVGSVLAQPATGDLVEKGIRVLLTSVFNFLMYKASDSAVQSLVYTAVWLLRRVLTLPHTVGAEATVAVGFIINLCVGPLLTGSSGLLYQKHFDPIEVYELIEKRKLVFLVLSGDTMINMLCDAAEPGEYDTSSVKAIVSTSMPTSPSTRKRLAERFLNMIFVDGLASSEVVVISARMYSHDMCMREEPTKFPMPSYAKVFDENYNLLPTGELGLIAQDAGAMSMGYYREPEKYDKTCFMHDGRRWITMGDYGIVDEDGWLTVVGRGSEVINTGGLKVWCEECEGVVIGHPKVKDVAFVGVPDEKWGEAVTALVQLKEGEGATEEEIIDWCKDKMADYKKPKHVVFGDVPYVGIGKKERHAIKKIVMEKLGMKG